MDIDQHRPPEGQPHGHDDAHPHPHPAANVEVLPEPSGPGSVVLDLGGDIGAAVIHVPPDLDGKEIEIRAEDGQWTGKHVAVRPRHLPEHTVYAALFEGLLSGTYWIRVRFGPPQAPEASFDVTGGFVTDVDWPSARGSGDGQL